MQPVHRGSLGLYQMCCSVLGSIDGCPINIDVGEYSSFNIGSDLSVAGTNLIGCSF